MLIKIEDYRADWPQEYKLIAARLRAAFGDVALRIDHIGSTSVPNLAAKDIIDIQVTVADLADQSIDQRVARSGYRMKHSVTTDVLVGLDASGDAQHPELSKRYAREQSGRRTHIHIREVNRVNQRYALVFRDYLRANDNVRVAYETAKRRLADVFSDADDYYAIKDPFMDVIYEGAQYWARLNNWSPGPGFD